jgi:hypothetical protein
MSHRLSGWSSLFAVPLLGALAACSGSIEPGSHGNEELPEGMGALESKILSVPADVRCVVVQSSDYRASYTRVDVTPGESATIRLAPLAPGWIYLYGEAYDLPCSALDYPYPPPSVDAGPDAEGTTGGSTTGGWTGGTTSGSTGGTTGGWQPPRPTWQADSVNAFVQPGQTASARLVFRRLGGIDVSIDFEEGCDPSTSFCPGPDGGVDGGDAGPDAN